ncbi:MAG TPA: DegT/DnrJ/EryC1/StrS family aminotransferase [Anaerolineales bacterium]|nr:DegT/DnrJ/EryC1/StrS family aminotransferase [Anaerolineales bacterium]HRQ92460.1 DegT/DnrJ/EryC1/StrS family aminotransferase [Anaerolineales bacterium]
MSSPDLTAAERQAVQAVMQSPVLSMGEHTTAFEAAVSDYVGSKYAIAVNSGTAGLHLCVRAAGIGTGDLVLTTPFSFVASTNVLLYENAVPIYVDVDPLTANIDPQRLQEAAHDLAQGGAAAARWLPRRGVINHAQAAKAVLPVDVFGQPADYDAILATAQSHQLTLIEDSCEALGAEYKGTPAGRFGHSGVFAFYPNKQMTTGEGGMIVTDDEQAAQLMRALRNQGRAEGDTWLEHSHMGYNYRTTELSAALGRIQLGRLNEMVAQRGQVAGWYSEQLADFELVETPQVVASTSRMSWFVYVVRLAPQIDRQAVIARLADANIPVRPYFTPIHLQKYMRERFGYQSGDFPITEDLGARSLALPFSSVMTQDQVSLVCAELQRAILA